MKNKLQLFGELLLPQNDFSFKRGGQYYEHMLVAKENGIIVLKIANNTHPERERNFSRWKEEDHPSLYVLIDNREEGKQVIAIENRIQAFSETKTVATIMEDSFNRHLYKNRLEVSISAKYHTHEFWNVVKEYDEGIASVKFNFPYPNLPQISDIESNQPYSLTSYSNSPSQRFRESSLSHATVETACQRITSHWSPFCRSSTCSSFVSEMGQVYAYVSPVRVTSAGISPERSLG